MAIADCYDIVQAWLRSSDTLEQFPLAEFVAASGMTEHDACRFGVRAVESRGPYERSNALSWYFLRGRLWIFHRDYVPPPVAVKPAPKPRWSDYEEYRDAKREQKQDEQEAADMYWDYRYAPPENADRNRRIEQLWRNRNAT